MAPTNSYFHTPEPATVTLTNQQIIPSELPSIDQIDFRPHPKRFLRKKLITDFLFMFPLLIGVGVVFYFFEAFYGWLALSAWVVILLLTLLFVYKGFQQRGYALRERDITYKHGWLLHTQVTVPFNRIQHTEINHGPIDRWFNLRELDIYTAGGASSDLSISGLDPEQARRIKEFLAQKVATHD